MRKTTSVALMLALSAAGAAGQTPKPKAAPKPAKPGKAPVVSPARRAPIAPWHLTVPAPTPAPGAPIAAPAPTPWPMPSFAPEMPFAPGLPVSPKMIAPETSIASVWTPGPVAMQMVPDPFPAPLPMPTPAPMPGAASPPAAWGLPMQSAQQLPFIATNELPPAATGQDPADILWNQARAEMNRQNYARAAQLFQRLIERYEKSQYVPNAYYWAAFSLYKRNAMSDLREAKRLLEEQIEEYPRASTRTEGEALLVRISGELASRGDAESAQAVTKRAEKAATQPCPETEDDEVRAAALNALMRMGSENAMPLLRQIMRRRDACSAELRRMAVYMITRQDSPEREALLLEAVRSDPDPEVKKNAVFWMARSPSEKALEAIQEVMRTTDDPEIQQVAVHALSQHDSPRASALLRELAGSRNVSTEVRQAAVHWIGQKDDPANGPFLRNLFGRVNDNRVKESILHIMSRRNDSGNAEWLLGIARNRQESEQIRKAALFWASQGRGIPSSEFAKLYDTMPDAEMKQQIMYSLSRRNDSASITKLIEIAKSDGDADMRKTAIFWLSQSKDPRAIKAIQEIAGG